MAMIECRDCYRIADARCFRRCVRCGVALCDACADKNSCLCGDCAEYD